MGMKEAKAKLDQAAADRDKPKGEETGGDDVELKRKTKPPEDDDKDVEVSLEDDSDDDDEPGEADAGGKSRADKKRDRGRGFAAERDAERESAQRERDRADRLEASLLEVTRRLAPADRQEDPLDTELKSIEKRLEGLAERAEALGQKITPEQEKAIRAEAAELRRAEGRVNYKLAAREDRAEELRKSGGVTPEARARDMAVKSSLEAEFRDVYMYSRAGANGRLFFPALNFAKGEYTKRSGGETGMDHKLLRECLRDAEREYGLGNTRDASDGQRRKFSGVPRGTGGHAAGGGPKTFTMTAEHRRMANALYKNVKDPNERYKMYAKKVGKKILEKAS